MSNSETPESGSLRADLSSALQGGGIDGPPPGGAEVLPSAATPPVPEFKIPEKWPNHAKDAVKAALGLPDGQGRAIVDSWHNHWKETQGYTTKVEQERAQLRQQFDPLNQMLAPYDARWQLQGMDRQTGLRQLLGVADYLARDPQGGIKWIAGQYGIDLAKLIEGQPYVAPEVNELRGQLQQIQNAMFQQQQGQQQARMHSVVEQLKAFESATDAEGKPKWPHYGRLQDSMAKLITGGVASSLEEAYQRAFRLDDELQQEESASRAKREAEQRAAEARKADEASRQVRAKGTADKVPQKSLRDDLKSAFAGAGLS